MLKYKNIKIHIDNIQFSVPHTLLTNIHNYDILILRSVIVL